MRAMARVGVAISLSLFTPAGAGGGAGAGNTAVGATLAHASVAAVFAVRRVSPTLGVATYAIGQLMTGPTRAEARAGYYTELTRYFRGNSSCGPAGFTLTLDHKGAAREMGTTTVRFCRRFAAPGIGTTARITMEIRTTLRRFPRIKKVVILTVDGGCFGDLSGRNVCLQR